MHPSCEVVGFEHRRFFFLLPPVTLWIQDTSGLLDTIGHRSLAFTSWLFFSIPKYFESPSASPKKNVQPTFELLTPLSNNQHLPLKMCIKNPAKSANLHRLRHGFGHSHDGSLCPRICRIKGAILRPSMEIQVESVWNLKIAGGFVGRFNLFGKTKRQPWSVLTMGNLEKSQGSAFKGDSELGKQKSCSGFYSCWNFGCFVTHFWDLHGNYGLTSWQKLNIWPQETRQGIDFHLLS